MRILITGNMGYIGSAVVRHLHAELPGIELIGYDAGFFAHCLTTRGGLPEVKLKQQIFGDVRDLPIGILKSVDAVIHLAAVSNDPMGDRFAAQTDEINFRATLEVAKRAREADVERFVFASSCSVYGVVEGPPRREGDPLNPLTSYARSKVAAERALLETDLGEMAVTSLRFATACGMSDRLRLDLVLNDFVACALSSGEIRVLSDGSPWRPLIDVGDMARAIEWAILRQTSTGGQYLVVNVGSNEWNYQVHELAAAVAAEVPGTKILLNEDAPPDRRSYQVDFTKYCMLAPGYQPRMSLVDTVRTIRDGLRAIRFTDTDFRNSDQIRLRALERHIASGHLSLDLRWKNPSKVELSHLENNY